MDDDAETREKCWRRWAEEGARVTTAPSVAEAVAAIEQRWPDVLVSDIGMPGEGRLRPDPSGAPPRGGARPPHPGHRADRVCGGRGPATDAARGVRQPRGQAGGSVRVRAPLIASLLPQGAPDMRKRTRRPTRRRNRPVRIGYKLSSEEQGPRELVRLAGRPRRLGFSFALISDHFHPWIDRQGQSPFVWSVIGGIAQATRRLELGTGGHLSDRADPPALVAQAAATSPHDARAFLPGVGHGREPQRAHRRAGLARDRRPPGRCSKAVQVIRRLWTGGNVEPSGRYFAVENARLYTLPERRRRSLAAAAPSADLAGRWPTA